MLKDLFFPKLCLVCGHFGCYICGTCEKKLQPVILNTCLYCGKPSYLGLTHTSCAKEDGIDGILSLYSYNYVMRAIIKNIKYKGVYDAFHELFYVVSETSILKFYKFKRLYPVASLQAIPLHENKMKSRGFNQSVYIAKFFQSLFGHTTVNFLTRTKQTSAQAQIKDRKTRSANMKDAFSLVKTNTNQINMEIVILIDDVVTTGSTVKEAAKVLKKEGIQKVFVYSFARG